MLKLTDEQKRMCQGEYGAGVQKAMTMLVKYGNAYDAERMIRVDSAHTSPSIHPRFVSEVLAGVNDVRVPCTLHMTRICCTRWSKDVGINPQLAEEVCKQFNENMELFHKAGFFQTFTCVPFLTGTVIRKSMIFSWSESSAVLAGNSIFGAMGNRDGPPMSLCSAITGFTPEMLLHKPENRYAELLVHINGLDVENLNYADLGALGFYIGAQARDRKVAVTGLPPRLTYEELKYFITPMAVSGAVALCHVVGVTPEAPTVEAALHNRAAQETISVGKKELEEGYRSLNTAKTDDIDTVLFGCPHVTISEIKEIARLLDGKKVKEGVRLWVLASDTMYALAKRNGYVDIINRAGGLVITDTCISDHFYGLYGLAEDPKNVATNSAKAAGYHVRRLGVRFGSTEQCIAAAIKGKWGG